MLSNHLPYCWDDPPPCSYCSPCSHTRLKYSSSYWEVCKACCNCSSLSKSILWTTFSSIATSSINNCFYCFVLLFLAVLSSPRKKSRTFGVTLLQCFTLPPRPVKCLLNCVVSPPSLNNCNSYIWRSDICSYHVPKQLRFAIYDLLKTSRTCSNGSTLNPDALHC
jgi:hypothetical protein